MKKTSPLDLGSKMQIQKKFYGLSHKFPWDSKVNEIQTSLRCFLAILWVNFKATIMDNNIIKVDSDPSGFQIAAVYLVSLRYELLGRKGRRHSRLEGKIPEHVQGELQQTLPCLLMCNISLTLKDSETKDLLLCLLWDPTDKLQMFVFVSSCRRA